MILPFKSNLYFFIIIIFFSNLIIFMILIIIKIIKFIIKIIKFIIKIKIFIIQTIILSHALGLPCVGYRPARLGLQPGTRVWP